MGQLARDAALEALELLRNFQQEGYRSVEKKEQELDHMDDQLSTALVQLSAHELRAEDSHEVFQLLHTIGDFERMGDHAMNLAESAQELYGTGLQFTDLAKEELSSLFSALQEIMELAITAFDQNDDQIARHIEPLEEVIDELTQEIRNRHIRRLQNGSCDIQMGMILTDVLTNCERMSDHCSNIGLCVINSHHDEFQPHDYLLELKSENAQTFSAEFSRYQEKYKLAK